MERSGSRTDRRESCDKSAWSAYRPSDACPGTWSGPGRSGSGAGFAATWAELERDLADGPERAVRRVLAGECCSEGVPASFEFTATLLGDSAGSSSDPRRLQAWWLYRMLFSPDPLQERLTLMWHDHFATSQLKVEDTAAMRAQNETFRRLARGPFGDLLRAMLRDRRLLVWLDAASNRKGKPDENLARELLELFAAWRPPVSRRRTSSRRRPRAASPAARSPEYQSRDDYRDDGEKTILGKTVRFEGDALADHLLSQPAVANRLAWRLCAAFLGEGVADDAARGALADQLRRDGLHVGRAMATIVRSELFFSARNLRARVSDPVGFAVGAARALELFDPPPSTLLLAEWTARMGQSLFYPPNVGGWPGGRSWLTGRAVVALEQISPRSSPPGSSALEDQADRPEPARVEARPRNGTSATIAWFGELLTGRRGNPPSPTLLRASGQGVCARIPEYVRRPAPGAARGQAHLSLSVRPSPAHLSLRESPRDPSTRTAPTFGVALALAGDPRIPGPHGDGRGGGPRAGPSS
ncbi:MAG: DUF1800 family protein [Isosphaeraceae bacterium]